MPKGVLGRYAEALSADEQMAAAMRQAPIQGRRGEWSAADRALRASANAAAARAVWQALCGVWARPGADRPQAVIEA